MHPNMPGIEHPSTGEPNDPGNSETREKLRKMLRAGNLDDREVEIELDAKSGSRKPLLSGLELIWK